MTEKDTFNTIATASEGMLFKDKNSKFFGYAIPIHSKDEIKDHLIALKKKHHSARHWCYAWQTGTTTIEHRVNDDGEPSNSAGMPIYGQIKSFELTNVLVVVVRYFGGVKLGVGGLINAYRSAAKIAIESVEIIEKTIDILYEITFDYKNINKVMRIIKENNLTIINQKMELNCTTVISVRKKNATKILKIFEALFEVQIKNISN
ncbi:YigZ family protein [Flavobacteriaceae bacterium R38]|nr:YigZ family protein [Flavobacteriaceae bacterium R38]